MADRIFILNEEGAIVQSGSPSETWLGPVDRFVTELFGPVNRLSGVVRLAHREDGGGQNLPPPPLPMAKRWMCSFAPMASPFVREGEGGEDGLYGRILSARLLGRVSHLRIAIDENVILNARLSGVILPKEGTRIQVLIEKCSVFVFPKNS